MSESKNDSKKWEYHPFIVIFKDSNGSAEGGEPNTISNFRAGDNTTKQNRYNY